MIRSGTTAKLNIVTGTCNGRGTRHSGLIDSPAVLRRAGADSGNSSLENSTVITVCSPIVVLSYAKRHAHADDGLPLLSDWNFSLEPRRITRSRISGRHAALRTNADLMLVQRRRRWPNVKPALGERFHVFWGMTC